MTAVFVERRVQFQEILPSLLRTAAREIAVAVEQSPRVNAVEAVIRASVEFVAWAFRARRAVAGRFLVQATVVAILFAGRFLSRVIDVASRTDKVATARTVG